MTEADGTSRPHAEEFCQLACQLLPTDGAEKIKLIGGAIMLRPRCGDAVRLGLQIVCDVGLRHVRPPSVSVCTPVPRSSRSGD